MSMGAAGTAHSDAEELREAGWTGAQLRAKASVFANYAGADPILSELLAKRLEQLHPGINGRRILSEQGKVLGRQQARNDRAYAPRTYREMQDFDHFEEIVENVIPAKGVACVYGQSGSGKTFLALDFALTIARGDKFWFGYRVARKRVAYLALEGEAGLRDRLKAHELGTGRSIPDSLLIISAPLNLGNEDDVTDLAEQLKAHAVNVIIVDTLARATPGMDLNTDAGMGLAVDSLDRLRRAINGLALAIHHSTQKENSPQAKEMGHSRLRGALDSSIFVWSEGTVKQWQTAKLKESQDGKGHGFALKSVEVRRNQWDNPRTSCYVTESHRPRYDPEADQRAMADQLESYIVAGFKSEQRRYLTLKNLEDKPPPGFTKRDCKPTVAELVAQGRIAEVKLPPEQRHGKRQEYLHPIARIPIAPNG